MPDAAAPPPPGRTSRWPTASPTLVARLSLVSMVMVALIVLTGAAVRLTGSGLGCADWPTCSAGHLTPPVQFHSLVEFGNRLVTVLITVVVAVTFVAVLRRRPFRSDLTWLAGGLVLGIVAEAVIGGIVVYTKLNPYLVMVHFVATMVLLADAVVLVHRSTRDYSPGSGRALVPRPVLLGGRGLLGLLGVVIAAGSATSGAGPHAGSSNGQEVAKRIPVALRSMAELHSSLALLLVGVTVGMAVAVHALDVPERVRRASRILVVVLMMQAAVGYTQYFTHLPALLVELHVAGATALVIGFLQFFLALTWHPAEQSAGDSQGTSDGPRPAAGSAPAPRPTEGAAVSG